MNFPRRTSSAQPPPKIITVYTVVPFTRLFITRVYLEIGIFSRYLPSPRLVLTINRLLII
jgi:hypothetical protein